MSEINPTFTAGETREYRIVWDNRRQIFKTKLGETKFIVNTPSIDTEEQVISLTKYGPGVLLTIGCDGSSDEYLKFNFMLEICRIMVDDTELPHRNTKKVLVPLCGAKVLYDNGYAIGGYVWENGLFAPTSSEAIYESYSYSGGLVQCSADKLQRSEFSQWKTGDVIYNVGDDNSWNVEIIKK